MPQNFWSDQLPPVKEGLKEHNLFADKSFGQNFLFDLNLTRKIVRESGDLSNTHLMEVGPGPGGLTRILLETNAKSLTLIEKDERLSPLLTALIERYKTDFKDQAKPTTLLFDDALTFNLKAIDRPDNDPIYIIANLPYNVATPLLIGWLKQLTLIAGMSLMFQKEVALRITAQQGDKHYGRLAILANHLCETRILMNLPAQAFTPPPKVNSAVVQLIPRQNLNERMSLISPLEKVTALAFNQRRKMLRGSLKPLLNDNPTLLETCGIKETARAEEISIDGFIKLAKAIA